MLGYAEDIDDYDPSFLEQEAALLKWEEDTMNRYEVWRDERTILNVHVFICSVSQIILIYLLFMETIASFDLSQIVEGN